MYSNSFDYEVNNFHFAVEEFLEDTEYMGICESLLLPVEEGIGESFKRALTYLYKKFHAILESFKRWVKKVIQKVKSFFIRGKKKDSKEDTTKDDSSKKNAPTPEEAKKVVEDMNEVLKTANSVDSELKKASSNENVTKEEADTVTKKADDVSKQMTELKSRVETKYLAIPQWTTAGKDEFNREIRKEAYLERGKKNKEFNETYDFQTGDQAHAIADDMANKNYFKLKHPEEYVSIVSNFIIVVGNIESGNKVRFRLFKDSVGDAADCILNVLTYNKDTKDVEDEGAKRMFAYMSQKIPKQIREWISRRKSFAEEAKAEGTLDKIFVNEPTMQNLNRCVDALKGIMKKMQAKE